ncbi:MAG: hypothetical protein JOZ69_19695 [Myxococcales bacterium]|nr:hypothetical protein [Myxococcales bacterium]
MVIVRSFSFFALSMVLGAVGCGTSGPGSGATEDGGPASSSGSNGGPGGSSAGDPSGRPGSGSSGGGSGSSSGSGSGSSSSGSPRADGGARKSDAGSGSDAGFAGTSSGSNGSSGSGSSGDGGSSGSPSAGQTGAPPGDLANASGVSVVAAHSMTRALFAAYTGRLFQASRASDKQKMDISVTAAGGRVDATALTAFCAGTTCAVSVLYDQTGNGNDLKQATQQNMPTIAMFPTKGGTVLPYALTQNSGGPGAIGGDPTGQFLRNRNQTKKVPTGSAAQTEYMVVYAKYFKGHCCYDYGNVETGIRNDGPGTMSALYFGQTKDWTFGVGSGPWGMVDMEDGVFSFGGNAGNVNPANGNPAGMNASDPAFAFPGTNLVGVMAKTNGTSSFTLKVGDVEQGKFTTAWSGALPNGYAPLHQEGGLSLGEGGDGSDNVDGAFFEGFVVAGEESDATDVSIQTNLSAYFTR